MSPSWRIATLTACLALPVVGIASAQDLRTSVEGLSRESVLNLLGQSSTPDPRVLRYPTSQGELELYLDSGGRVSAFRPIRDLPSQTAETDAKEILAKSDASYRNGDRWTSLSLIDRCMKLAASTPQCHRAFDSLFARYWSSVAALKKRVKSEKTGGLGEVTVFSLDQG